MKPSRSSLLAWFHHFALKWMISSSTAKAVRKQHEQINNPRPARIVVRRVMGID
jgi:hypothetical protein